MKRYYLVFFLIFNAIVLRAQTLEELFQSEAEVEEIQENALQKDNYLFKIGKVKMYTIIDSIVNNCTIKEKLPNQSIKMFFEIDSLGEIIELYASEKWFYDADLCSELVKTFKKYSPLNPMQLISSEGKVTGFVNKFRVIVKFCGDGSSYITFLYPDAWSVASTRGDKTCPL